MKDKNLSPFQTFTFTTHQDQQQIQSLKAKNLLFRSKFHVLLGELPFLVGLLDAPEVTSRFQVRASHQLGSLKIQIRNQLVFAVCQC